MQNLRNSTPTASIPTRCSDLAKVKKHTYRTHRLRSQAQPVRFALYSDKRDATQKAEKKNLVLKAPAQYDTRFGPHIEKKVADAETGKETVA